MVVEDALRIAGRTRRITKCHRGTLIEYRPVIGVVLGGDQGLVAHRIGQTRFGHVFVVSQYDEALHTLQLLRHLLHQRHEQQIHHDPFVFGVIDDVDDLLREQAWIDGVADVAGATDRVISLQVPVIVPGQCRDAIPVLDAELVQRICQLPRPAETVCIRVTVQWVVGRDRDDLPIAEIGVRVLQ